MDLISQLPDELLVKILSLLPTANEVVATMILSKRWQFLWRMVSKLLYHESYQNLDYARFSRFIERSLFLHEAPVVETLHFKLCETCGTDDIHVWIRAANKLNVRELIFELDNSFWDYWTIFPRSFYTGFSMLVTLKLSCVILVDVTSPISFPSLKNMSLLSVKYPSAEFFNMLLSNCPVLEDLVLEQCLNDNVSICTIRVPSLKSLYVSKEEGSDVAVGFVIDAPSLVILKIIDFTHGFCFIENEMPMIVTVDVDIPRSNLGNILCSVTSVKHLCLCLSTAEDLYPVGSVFHQLISLTLYRWTDEWSNILICMLEASPRLQSLTLDHCYPFPDYARNRCWIKPSLVPDCLLSSLETFVFKSCDGAEEDKHLTEYMLGNGACLKKVTISTKPSCSNSRKLEMLKVLTLSSIRSPNCQLAFQPRSYYRH